MSTHQLSLFDHFNFPLNQPIEKPLPSSLPYIQVKNNIPLDLPNQAFISIERHSPLKVYALGFQPAKTISEIPHWFLQKYTSPGTIVLEPFAGSGTSLITALKLNRPIIWLDYHPLSQLVCRVKTTRFPLIEILTECDQIIADANNQNTAPDTVKFSNKDFWFQQPVQQGLEILKDKIFSSKALYQPVLLLAFASTVRKCSDMNDGMLLAARRPNVKNIPKRTRSDVFKYFQFYVNKTIEALSEWYQISWDSAYSKELPVPDARNLKGDWTCDAIVTSPPYINAIDYVWAAKFELHWLGLVKNDQDRLNLYSQEIGTERIPSSEYKQLAQTGHQVIDTLIAEIYSGKKYQASKGQNQLRARVVYKYFMDMKHHLASSYNKLSNRGYYCFAVGDISKICGVDIPVADFLVELATDLGFCEVFRFHLLLKNRKLNIPRNVDWAGTIKHDTIVVLQKY